MNRCEVKPSLSDRSAYFFYQACSVKAQYSLDEIALGKVEMVLEANPRPYSQVYDSDDEETQAIRSRMPRTWGQGDAFVAQLSPLSADDLHKDRSDTNWAGSNGWMSEIVAIDRKRREENDDLSSSEFLLSRWLSILKSCSVLYSDEDSESDSVISWFDGPKPGNRRGSCTL
jgi:hypothetical protein